MTSAEISFYRQAVREGNLAALRLFLKDFDSKDKEQQGSLVITGVTEAPSLSVLKSLLAMGLPLDFVEEEKRNTLLHFAACSNHPEIPRYLLQQGLAVDIPQGDLVPVLLLGLVNTGLGCYLYFSAISRLPVQTVAICGYLEPLAAVVLSAILLGEGMGILQILGTVLILGGAMFAEMRGHQ